MKNNKACNKKLRSFLFGVICLVLFNSVFVLSGCGLDTFYFIEAPKYVTGPQLNTGGFENKSFIFNTNEKSSDDGFAYMGTDIYYKIYSDHNTCNYERESLVKSSQGETANASDRLIYPEGSGGYGFQQLKLYNSTSNVLIPYVGHNQKVEIRLTDSPVAEFVATVRVDGKTVGVPVRYNNKSFNFGRSNNKPDPKLSSELDVKKTNSPDNDDKWHLCLFAVSKGHDAAYTNYFSNIEYLGSVTINSSTIYN